MLAYGKLLRELGYSVSFLLDEKYLSFADFSAIGPTLSAGAYAEPPDRLNADVALFYNAAVANAETARRMRAAGTRVLYVFHEPVPIVQRLSETGSRFSSL